MRNISEQMLMGNNSEYTLKNNNSAILTMLDNSNQTTKGNSREVEDVLDGVVAVLVSDEAAELILLVISCIIRGTMTFFGIIFNIINVIVFTKLGFQDTSNTLFLAIAIADLGALVTLLLGSVCQNPPMFNVFQNVDMAEILFLASAWPHYYFTRVSSILTCQITIERYLCIAFPLAVRRLIRPSRAVTSIVAVYSITLVSVVPIFTSSQLGYEFNYAKNTTIFGLILSQNMVSTIQTMNLFNNIIQIIAFFIVSLATAMLVHKLATMSKWRNANASAVNDVSSRDKRIARMVISNAVSFIVCYTPVLGIRFTSPISSVMLKSDYYRNLMTILAATAFLTVSVHSTVRIFVYAKASSSFRHTLLAMFVCHQHVSK